MKHLLLSLLLLGSSAFAASPLPGASFDLGFSPGGSSLQVVLSGIRQAKTEILVAAYGFTSKDIATALLDARQRGVRIQIVADRKANERKYSATTFLANKGIPVRLNGQYAIHHHKFMVIDGRHVETGSFNYSQAAVKSNAENALLLWNVPALAVRYRTEWQRLWAESQPLSPAY
jgi:phosphatidylserine/phosphatidylglycerophosphate/cardiolipin synthase-like enzyme